MGCRGRKARADPGQWDGRKARADPGQWDAGGGRLEQTPGSGMQGEEG